MNNERSRVGGRKEKVEYYSVAVVGAVVMVTMMKVWHLHIGIRQWRGNDQGTAIGPEGKVG
jgi:hypothetical protein